jgi:hypothetical protein
VADAQLLNEPSAIFHELGEYILESNKGGRNSGGQYFDLSFEKPSTLLLSTNGVTTKIPLMGADKISKGAQALVLKDPNSSHYLLRALSYVVFQDLDIRATERIRGLKQLFVPVSDESTSARLLVSELVLFDFTVVNRTGPSASESQKNSRSERIIRPIDQFISTYRELVEVLGEPFIRAHATDFLMLRQIANDESVVWAFFHQSLPRLGKVMGRQWVEEHWLSLFQLGVQVGEHMDEVFVVSGIVGFKVIKIDKLF